MPLDNVVVGDAVKQSTVQALINFVNSHPAREIYLANGTFTLPASCPGGRFKVTMCGGGGGGAPGTEYGEGYPVPGAYGGTSAMASFILSGQAAGTTYAITVGAGGAEGSNGGNSTFGVLATSTGGLAGGIVSGGSYPGGAIYVANESFMYNPALGYGGYGRGGAGGQSSGYAGQPGLPGIVVIEW